MKTDINWISVKEKPPKKSGEYLVLARWSYPEYDPKMNRTVQITPTEPKIFYVNFLKEKDNYGWEAYPSKDHDIWYLTFYGDGEYRVALDDSVIEYWSDLETINFTR